MKYELILIFNKNIDLAHEIYKIKENIENLGSVDKIKSIGEKTLAYEVKKQNTGFYVLIYFAINNKKDLSYIVQNIKNNNNILKHIIVENN